MKSENLQYRTFNDDTDLETGTSGFINEVLSPTSGLTLQQKIMLLSKVLKKEG
jgi:hypothetical protein